MLPGEGDTWPRSGLRLSRRYYGVCLPLSLGYVPRRGLLAPDSDGHGLDLDSRTSSGDHGSRLRPVPCRLAFRILTSSRYPMAVPTQRRSLTSLLGALGAGPPTEGPSHSRR